MQEKGTRGETIESLLANKTPEMVYQDFEFIDDCKKAGLGGYGLQMIHQTISGSKEIEEEK